LFRVQIITQLKILKKSKVSFDIAFNRRRDKSADMTGFNPAVYFFYRALPSRKASKFKIETHDLPYKKIDSWIETCHIS